MRKVLYPAFVGGYMSRRQKDKLLALARAGRWTIGEALRVLVDAAEVRPAAITVTVSLPEPHAPPDA